MDAINVLVVGTEPPCPRCDLLTLRAQEAAGSLERLVKIRHCPLFSDEAVAIGQVANRRLGTPQHVADVAGLRMDWDRRDELIRERRRIVGEPARPAELWTPALDAFLEPCREAANAVGFWMTPILVVNGVVVHCGNVPTVGQIREWLASA